jgi:hypothetical protein
MLAIFNFVIDITIYLMREIEILVIIFRIEGGIITQ